MKTTKGMKIATVWKLCLDMWDWIVYRIRAGDKRDVNELKLAWCKGRNFDLRAACFFCDYALLRTPSGDLSKACHLCPGVQVHKSFCCHRKEYFWFGSPLKFHAKLHRMNKKRLKK